MSFERFAIGTSNLGTPLGTPNTTISNNLGTPTLNDPITTIPKGLGNHPINNPHSTTGVYPPRKHGFGIWGNPRVPMTVRVDKEIKKQFKSFSKRVFGSTCLPLESLIAGLLQAVTTAENKGVYPSSTVPLRFDVGKIVIERNLRPRRKLDWKPDDIGFSDVDACGLCGHPFNDVAYRVEYVSGKFDVLCKPCYEVQRDRSVVKKIVSRLTPGSET